MELNGIKLTPTQADGISIVADALESIGLERGMSETMFRNFHEIRDKTWVSKDSESFVVAKERGDGKWDITTVSTAAIADREGETFDAVCIDWDANQAKIHKEFPEYRLFHKKYLAIGKVDKMFRAGIFAIDQGISYDDPFSLSVCKEMLANNTDGKWRCSRGFQVFEASGQCPECGTGLVLKQKHMIAGFKCPTCKMAHLDYKARLKEVHFRKARTFDVTITDIPCLPWTGVSAMQSISMEDLSMNKKELKAKLLEAKIPEDEIDERLKSVDENRLKELSDLPFAEVLKEFKDEEEKETPEEEQIFTLDPEVLKDFTDIVKKEVKSALEGLTIDFPEDIEVKEVPGLTELKEQVAELTEAVNALLEKDETRLKELVGNAPRGAKLRIQRYKTDGKKKKFVPSGEDAADDEEDMDEEEETKEFLPPHLKELLGSEEKEQADSILGADGKSYKSVTDFVMGGRK